MEPSNVKSRKRRSALWVAEFFVLIIALIGFTSVGYLGWKYYKTFFNGLGDTNRSSNSTNSNSTNFTSNVVFEPSGGVVDLVSKSAPSVVTVISKSDNRTPGDNTDDQTEGVGTGFFVTEDGTLITNEHVVCGSPKAETLSIITSDNKSYTVDSFVVDSVQDIAILKVNTNGDKVKALKFANVNSALMTGQDVIAIGNPLGTNPGSVTKGIISGLNRNISAQGSCLNKAVQKDYEGVIQTDAAINSGNSGGPLLNFNGEVIGVNSATSSGANNISYSVPFQRVLKILQRYQSNNGKLTFPFLGVQYTMIDPTLSQTSGLPIGALARSVVGSSAADKAGIQKGDIITKINDRNIEFSLQADLNQYFEPNQKVKIEIFRPSTLEPTGSTSIGGKVKVQGKNLTLDVTIGEK